MEPANALPQKAEVVIIGGGVIGTSIAFHLAEDGCKDIVLLEKDSIASAASCRAAGVISHMGWNQARLPIKKHSWALWEKFNADGDIELTRLPTFIPLREKDDPGLKAMMKAIPEATNAFYGEELVKYLEGPEEVLKVIPDMKVRDISDLGDLEGAILGAADDAYVDPYLMTMTYAKHARNMGADIRTKVLVTGIRKSEGRVTAVETDQGEIACNFVVNAGGAWAPKIGQMAGITIPVKPCRRILLTFKQREKTERKLGVIMIDEIEAQKERRGMYMRDDANGFVGAGSHNTNGLGDEPVDPDNYDQSYSHDDVLEFAEKLYEFLPDFGDLEVVDGWANLYGNVRDSMYIIDKVDNPKGLILCCGFCGEGIANSAGAGKMVSELILDGKISLVADPSGFAFNSERFPELKEA